jgi:hypothetical protein
VELWAVGLSLKALIRKAMAVMWGQPAAEAETAQMAVQIETTLPQQGVMVEREEMRLPHRANLAQSAWVVEAIPAVSPGKPVMAETGAMVSRLLMLMAALAASAPACQMEGTVRTEKRARPRSFSPGIKGCPSGT